MNRLLKPMPCLLYCKTDIVINIVNLQTNIRFLGFESVSVIWRQIVDQDDPTFS